jgi:hypothetical protein
MQSLDNLNTLYLSLAQTERLLKRPAEAAAATRERQNLWQRPANPRELYNSACEFALCIPLVGEAGKPLTESERGQRHEYADRAMEALRQAVHAGFKNPAHAMADKDLEPLRSLPDFQSLFGQPSFPADPFVH